MPTITVKTELEVKTCKNCGGTYALNEDYLQMRREKGGEWHCPYCQSSWVYRETDLMKAQEALAQQKVLIEKAEQEKIAALQEADYFRKDRNKILKRVENGVCPYCHRSFQNLRRHINTKHKQKCNCKKRKSNKWTIQ